MGGFNGVRDVVKRVRLFVARATNCTAAHATNGAAKHIIWHGGNFAKQNREPQHPRAKTCGDTRGYWCFNIAKSEYPFPRTTKCIAKFHAIYRQ